MGFSDEKTLDIVVYGGKGRLNGKASTELTGHRVEENLSIGTICLHPAAQTFNERVDAIILVPPLKDENILETIAENQQIDKGDAPPFPPVILYQPLECSETAAEEEKRAPEKRTQDKMPTEEINCA